MTKTIDMHSQLFKAEWSLLEAYESGEISYEDAYRHCFKTARLMAWIIQGSSY